MSRSPQWPPPVYTDPRGYARARVWIDGCPRNVHLGKPGSAEARARYARLLHEGPAGEASQPAAPLPPALADPQTVTVAEAVARFLSHAEQTYDPRGREPINMRLALAPVLALYGTEPVRAFGTTQLEAVQTAMADGSWMNEEERAARARRGQSCRWSRNVVNRRIVRIRTCWRWLERAGLVPEGRYAHLLTVPTLSANIRWVRVLPRRKGCTRQDLDKVVALAPGPVAALLEVEWHCGARPGELRVMEAADVDCTVDPWEYRPGRHKGSWRDGDRVIVLGPEAQRILAPWLERAQGGYVFPPLLGRRQTGSPEKYRQGACYQPESLSRAVARAARRAGVALTAYQARHAAKRRLTRSHNLDVARAVLGQKSLGTTAGYDEALDLDAAARAMRECG
jgi:site-specific recombinase XerD